MTLIAEVTIRLLAFGSVRCCPLACPSESLCRKLTLLLVVPLAAILAVVRLGRSPFDLGQSCDSANFAPVARRYWNALDLAITLFCAVTLVVIFFSGCSAKGEEVFDTFLLVARNLFQFGRLALVLRK